MRNVNLEYEVEWAIADFQRQVIGLVRGRLRETHESWIGTMVEGQLALRNHRVLENFLQNLYEKDKKDLQSQKSLLQ